MKVLLFALVFSCASVFAQEPAPATTPAPVPTPVPSAAQDSAPAQPRHIISIGTSGFGWSGTGTVFDWDKDKSNIKDHEVSESEFDINYTYVFPNRIMLGAFVGYESSRSEVKRTTGTKTESEEYDSEIGIGVGYNFNEDIYNSWWVAAIVSSGNHEEETKNSSGTEDFEYGYKAFYLKVGKRFNLGGWGLRNISYNPTITFASATVDGDAEDAGLDGMSQAQLEILKIDILF